MKGEILTSVQKFIVTTHRATQFNRYALTEYAIRYTGTAENVADISMFVGGFRYGSPGETLKLHNTILLAQGRPISDCIDRIEVGDWVVLAAGKVFGAPNRYFEKNHAEYPFDLDEFKEWYHHRLGALYAAPAT